MLSIGYSSPFVGPTKTTVIIAEAASGCRSWGFTVASVPAGIAWPKPPHPIPAGKRLKVFASGFARLG